MVALNEELSGIAGEPQARSDCGAAEGAMTFPPKNQSNPRSVPYCSESYFPGSDFPRHYARNRNYSPSLESVLRQEPKSRLSTGVAHREINQDPAGYPGAAAHCRGVGTGFRGADEERKCIEHRSLPLNINGANMYQFVMSNPVGNVDPWGLEMPMDPAEPLPPFPIPEGGVPGGGASYNNFPPPDTGGEQGALRVWNTEHRYENAARGLRQFCPLALPPSTIWWSNISGPRLISGPDMPKDWFISVGNSLA